MCHLRGSNTGPSDLQSDALPAELKRLRAFDKFSNPRLDSVPSLDSVPFITQLVGHVFLAKKLDYEVNKVIVISVRLQCERVESSMLLDLKIINENDEPPIFNEPDGTIIKVNEKYTGPIGLIQAADPDSNFKLSVVENPFVSISNTGIIKTSQKLFYSQNEYLAFEICAVDSNGNSGKTTRKGCSHCVKSELHTA